MYFMALLEMLHESFIGSVLLQTDHCQLFLATTQLPGPPSILTIHRLFELAATCNMIKKD